MYEQYDEKALVDRMKGNLEDMRVTNPHIDVEDGASSSNGNSSNNISMLKVPSEPSALSFWVAQNLPLVDAQRANLLEINSSVQRLRWEYSFLEKVMTVLFYAWVVQCGNELYLTLPLIA